jgi:hypothetical protein
VGVNGGFKREWKVRTFFVTSLSISDPGEGALAVLELREGREGARVFEMFDDENELLEPPPVNASEAAATLPTELLTCGLLAIWSTDSGSLGFEFKSACTTVTRTCEDVPWMHMGYWILQVRGLHRRRRSWK